MAALLTSVTGQHRRRGEVHQRMPRDGHSGRAARHQRQRRQLHAARQAIRFGLAAVKNVGHNAIESIVAGAQRAGPISRRSSSSARSVDLRLLNKRVLESLIKSGAMDALGRRAQTDGRHRQSHGARAESAARCRVRPAWVVRRFQQEETQTAHETSCPTFPTGTSTAPGLRKGNPRLLHHRPSAGEISGQAGRIHGH